MICRIPRSSHASQFESFCWYRSRKSNEAELPEGPTEGPLDKLRQHARRANRMGEVVLMAGHWAARPLFSFRPCPDPYLATLGVNLPAPDPQFYLLGPPATGANDG